MYRIWSNIPFQLSLSICRDNDSHPLCCRELWWESSLSEAFCRNPWFAHSLLVASFQSKQKQQNQGHSECNSNWLAEIVIVHSGSLQEQKETWTGVHVSMYTDRTKLTWTPRLLCLPAHSRQMRVPWFTLPQSVSRDGQSQHFWFPGYSLISFRTLGGKGPYDISISYCPADLLTKAMLNF